MYSEPAAVAHAHERAIRKFLTETPEADLTHLGIDVARLERHAE